MKRLSDRVQQSEVNIFGTYISAPIEVPTGPNFFCILLIALFLQWLHWKSMEQWSNAEMLWGWKTYAVKFLDKRCITRLNSTKKKTHGITHQNRKRNPVKCRQLSVKSWPYQRSVLVFNKRLESPKGKIYEPYMKYKYSKD